MTTSSADERAAIIEVVDRLFVSTDRKDWKAVQRLFSDKVDFDMTSLAGGAPMVLTPTEITNAWDQGLKDVDVIHHQSGNHLVQIQGQEAAVFCYATATHWRSKAQKRVTTFVGSYDLKLKRGTTGWQITHFRLNKKYVE